MKSARVIFVALAATLPGLAYACGGPEGEVLHYFVDADGATPDAAAPIDAADGDAARADALGPDAEGADADADASVTIDAGPDADADTADACAGKDLSSDPAHCGACFHDCLGGPCSGGRCGPSLLATVPSPAGIAVDSDHVYFASVGADAGVYATRKDGSNQTLIASHLSFPERVALAGAHVLYTTVGTPGLVGKVEPDGTGQTALAITNTGPLDVVSDGTDVFFVDQYSASIRHTTIAGEADGGKGDLVAAAGSYPWGIALTPTDIVWTSRGTLLPPDAGIGFASDGRVRAISRVDGGAPRDLASGLATPLAVVADGATLYWVNGQGGTVMRFDDGAAAPVTIASGLVSPWGIALDATYAYVTCNGIADGSGVVVRVAKDGSSATPEVLAEHLAFPSTIVIDATAIYWTNTHGASVMKLAK